MQLYEIPKNSKIKVMTNILGERIITFHHVDGMYSLCTIDGIEGDDKYVHLSVMTPLKLIDGIYEIDDTETT